MNSEKQNRLPPYEPPPMPLSLTEQELQVVEDMAMTGFSPKEVAEVLEVNQSAFELHYKSGTSAIYKRYRKGYLLGQLKLRQRIAKDAEHGSSPAQTLMKKIYDECEYQLKQL